jgi:predicted regulator of Ras-like GTPase activity (Roadblock/LC7/MglB family)
MGIRGNLRDMGLADLIQHTCQDRKTAQLEIQSAGVQAYLFFKDGNLVHAQSGGETGEEVVYRILKWDEGSFTLETGVEPPATTIVRVWSSLLLEGARRLDETGQSLPVVGFELNDQLEVNPMVNFEEILGQMGAEVTGYLGSALIGTDGIPIAAHPPMVKFDPRSGPPPSMRPGGPPPGMGPGGPGGPGGPPPGMGPGGPGGPGGPPPGMGPGGPGGPGGPPPGMGPGGPGGPGGPPSTMDMAEAISAQMTMLLKLVDTTSNKINIGEVEDNLTTTDFAYVMMRFVPGRKYFLGLTVDRRAGNLGNMRLISKMYANRISQLLPG